MNFPDLLFKINSISVSSLLKTPFPITSLLGNFLSSILTGTIAVRFSALLISVRHVGHFLILSFCVELFNRLIIQGPQKICVQSNIIGCVILSKQIAQVLFSISVILSVQSFNLSFKLFNSTSIKFNLLILTSSGISNKDI